MHENKHPIVITRIFGGIGNQLFIYAAARRLSKKNKADLVLDSISGFKYDYDYERHYQLDHFNILSRKASKYESLEPFSKVRRFVKRYLNNFKPYNKRSYIFQNNSKFDERLLELNFQKKKKLYLEGYWQNQSYFIDIEDTIRKDLQIKPPTDKANIALAEEINKNTSIAIHVRFFNDPNSEEDISTEYYNRAIGIMEKKFPDAKYYLFSDL